MVGDNRRGTARGSYFVVVFDFVVVSVAVAFIVVLLFMKCAYFHEDRKPAKDR